MYLRIFFSSLLLFALTTGQSFAQAATADIAAPLGMVKEVEQKDAPTKYSGEIGGVPYTYYISTTGQVVSGSVDGPMPTSGYLGDPDFWAITVDRDKMTDAVRWYVHHYQTGLMIRMSTSGQALAVCVVGSNFPGRFASVRVGNQRALSFSNNCSSVGALALQGQLLKGGRLLVRRYEWPYDFPQDKEGSADNFDKIMQLFRLLVARR